ncbi:hypothetical protein A2368_00600 [Candidatus Collierbacteria bacterium RIFOXYB1_FULL_49_13]|uniref:Uncharacterized protein n=1 Tax=Candidatus Collierbacteria bacterium RIFOXYB1_FULL_49_13 TaxID=1817728 RepID=A0A1F5FHB2_9BACT|nr:MAG: hypothetical protein A2368_00600 [Candidatus Collierbacteria bacterium RIFOXYB1_FULL_49_13]
MYQLPALNTSLTIWLNQEYGDFILTIDSNVFRLDRQALKAWWESDLDSIILRDLDHPDVVIRIFKTVSNSETDAKIEISFVTAGDIPQRYIAIVRAEDLAEIFDSLLVY